MKYRIIYYATYCNTVAVQSQSTINQDPCYNYRNILCLKPPLEEVKSKKYRKRIKIILIAADTFLILIAVTG